MVVSSRDKGKSQVVTKKRIAAATWRAIERGRLTYPTQVASTRPNRTLRLDHIHPVFKSNYSLETAVYNTSFKMLCL